MSRSVFPPGHMDGIAGNLLPGDPLISYRSTKYKSIEYKTRMGKSKKLIKSLRTKKSLSDTWTGWQAMPGDPLPTIHSHLSYKV